MEKLRRLQTEGTYINLSITRHGNPSHLQAAICEEPHWDTWQNFALEGDEVLDLHEFFPWAHMLRWFTPGWILCCNFGCFDFRILLDMFDAFEIRKNNFLLHFPVTVGLLESWLKYSMVVMGCLGFRVSKSKPAHQKSWCHWPLMKPWNKWCLIPMLHS